MHRVIVAVNEYSIRKALRSYLESCGYAVIEAPIAALAVDCFKEFMPDAVILDIALPDVGGLVVLRKMKALNRQTPVILLADTDEMEAAVKTLGEGAYDYFPKPPDIERLTFTLARCIEASDNLKKARRATHSMLRWHLGDGTSMKRVIEDIEKAAESNALVNIRGENGTGKSLIARLIHNCDTEARGRFIQVDASTVIKSGASTRIDKLLKQAEDGTIYFKGVRTVSAVRQTDMISAVAAAAEDVKARVVTSFYTNLNRRQTPSDWIVIDVPPLAKRISDIPFLAGKFIAETADELNVAVRKITKDALKLLSRHLWPGNVRELRAVIRRAVLTSDCQVLKAEHFYFLRSNRDLKPSISLKDEKTRSVEDAERRVILKALDMSSGHKSLAAELLGISRKTLWEKLKTAM